jgi:FAD/FMN-containing dehydrogenase
VLSTAALDAIGHVDLRTRQVTAGAGVTIGALQEHAAAAGLAYGVDLASRDSATVGGTVATNAGGVRVVRHGATREQVLGVEVVLADGTVVEHLAGLPKDSAGYDLSGLMVGSEGTLGVVTAARLRLVAPLPAGRTTVLVGVGSTAAAIGLLGQPDLLAAELVVGPALDLVCAVTGLPFPLAERWPVYVLLETTGPPQLPDGCDAAVDRRVWAYRERQTEAVATLGVVHKLDVGVPVDRLADLVDALPSAWAPYDGYVFGHLAEGNLHVEVVGAAPDDEEVDDRVLRLVASLGGTISAEHGVGVAKTRWLGLSRSDAEVAAMRGIKRALDPDFRMNPGVLLG